MQGFSIRWAFTRELVSDGGEDTFLVSRFFELSRAEKVAVQDGVLVGIAILFEPFGYGIRNGGFAGASLTS
jgi:hypothetical protein